MAGTKANLAIGEADTAAMPVRPAAKATGYRDMAALDSCDGLLPIVEYPASDNDPFEGLPDASAVFGRVEALEFCLPVMSSCPLETTDVAKRKAG